MFQVAGIFQGFQGKLSLRGFMRVVGQPSWRLRDHMRSAPLRLKRQEGLGADRHQVKVVALAHPTYGCRPGHSQHDALDALTVGFVRSKVNWVLSIDIRGFFDHGEHGWLVKFIEHRIADRRIVRLIQKWLKAGVIEDGQHMQSEVGSPQGASFSPLAANIYLYYVFDLWAHQWRQRYGQGDIRLVRYVDDIVVGFEKRHGRAVPQGVAAAVR